MNVNEFKLQEVTEDEIDKVTETLSYSSSPGRDGFCSMILKIL